MHGNERLLVKEAIGRDRRAKEEKQENKYNEKVKELTGRGGEQKGGLQPKRNKAVQLCKLEGVLDLGKGFDDEDEEWK